MAGLLGLEVLWETLQTTAVPYLLGRLKGRTPPPPATGEGTRPEAPLQQQTTSVLSPRNDEAIQFAIDAALRKLPGGKQHISNIQAVREALEPHQQTDWRKNLGSLILTERFEHGMASETITRGGRGNQQQAGAAPAQGGQEKVERKFERRPRDYELTADDPRVQHLVLVSKIVSAEATPAQGVAKAKAYLLSAGLISKQSPAQRAAAAAEQGTRKATNAIHSYVGGVKSNDAELVRLENAIETAVSPEAKGQAEEALRNFLAGRSRLANTQREQKDRVGTFRFRVLIIIVVIAGLALATFL